MNEFWARYQALIQIVKQNLENINIPNNSIEMDSFETNRVLTQ